MYLDWLESGVPVYAIDIEGDSLDPSVIWCMCWRNVRTNEVGECIGHRAIQEFFENVEKDAVFVGHNILKFDAPVLVRLLGVRLSVNKCIDTLVLCTLYSPNIQGGHSLGAWGERMGIEKLDYNDFSRLTREMVVYCHRDVEITSKLFIRMSRTLLKIGFGEKSVEIQHKFTVILNKQHNRGFYFDGPRAMALYHQLRGIENDLKESIYEIFPPVLEEFGRYKRAYRKDGSFSSQYLRHCQQYERVVINPDDGSYTVYDRTPFNIGSPKQRTEKLSSLGWAPWADEYTPAGSPKPFDKGKLVPSLQKFLTENPENEGVKAIARWMTINGRANMINTWLDNWNETDSCIHGKLFVADTLRLRHQSPNTANIPAVRVHEVKENGIVISKHPLLGDDGDWTYESRDLWTARPGRVLVGTDAAGLELRMLAHYLNRLAFTKQVIEGDPHQYNADTVGISRPLAKTLLYAIQYGAQPRKVASIIKSSVAEGARVRTQFLDRLGLTGVMNDAIAEQEQGRIRLVDDSQVICPSPHAALNYRLQGGGARVMAQAAIFLEGHIRKHGLDSWKVGDIHDEWQYDVHPSDAEEHGRLAVQSIREAGEELNLNLPLDGESKIGLTWAETH